MSDHIALLVGAPPWEPHTEARVTREFNYWGMPTLGVLELHGQQYLFQCLLGANQPLHLWRYVHLDASDLARLDDVDDVYAMCGQVAEGRYYTLAFATDDLGVFFKKDVDEPWRETQHAQILTSFMDEAQRRLDTARSALDVERDVASA